jgi:hypothetical protein
MTLANKFIKRVASPLSTTIGYIRDGTSHLTPKDDWVEGLKKRAALIVHPYADALGRPLVKEKPDAEQFATTAVDSDKVEAALHGRYQRNLTSTRKYRKRDGERDWAVGSWVHDPDDTEWQHHVYLFDRPDRGTDLYAHKETSAEHDPYGHVTDGHSDGDPDAIARVQLEKAGIEYDD